MSIIKNTYHKLPVNVQKKVRKYIKYIRGDYKKYTNRPITKSELVKNLKDMGVHNGDILYVQSSLRSIGKVQGGAETVIAALFEAVGPEGTLAMPAFSMPSRGMVGTLEKNEVFDPAVAPSTVGLITETFRKRDGVLRSIHPTSSVTAYGANAKKITKGHNKANSNFGADTPLYTIMELGGKTLGIGVEIDKVSFYHTAEDVVQPFPIRVYLDKKFKAKVVDNGKITTMTLKAFDPEVSKTRIDKIPEGNWIRNLITEVLIDRGVLKWGYIGDSKSWIMVVKEFFKVYQELLGKKITIYTTESEYSAAGQKLIYYIKNYHSACSDKHYDYLNKQLQQIKKSYKNRGFWDPDNKNWIRQLDWNGQDWEGYVPHDWKYAIELQEGATHCAIQTGITALDKNLKQELGYIHTKITQEGAIEGIPDSYPVTSEEYEYGATLSSLALGFHYFKDKDPKFAEQILHDLSKVYKFMSPKFAPEFEDHHSVILRAYSNLLSVFQLLEDDKQIKTITTEIHNYAREFIKPQQVDGLFPFDPKSSRTALQMQLKADIALLQAYNVTKRKEYLNSAKKNFEWVINSLLLPNGGIKWNIKNSENFFEIHQMLFLICYKYLFDFSGGKYDYTPHAISAWKFLVEQNSANIDMYIHNYQTTGAFFSYRCVDNKGNAQSLKNYGGFKGTYELGYMLWALGLNRELFL